MRQRRDGGNQRRNNKQCRERPRRRAAEQRDELAALHVWMAPAWQEITSRAAQKSLAVARTSATSSTDGDVVDPLSRTVIISRGWLLRDYDSVSPALREAMRQRASIREYH